MKNICRSDEFHKLREQKTLNTTLKSIKFCLIPALAKCICQLVDFSNFSSVIEKNILKDFCYLQGPLSLYDVIGYDIIVYALKNKQI